MIHRHITQDDQSFQSPFVYFDCALENQNQKVYFFRLTKALRLMSLTVATSTYTTYERNEGGRNVKEE